MILEIRFFSEIELVEAQPGWLRYDTFCNLTGPVAGRQRGSLKSSQAGCAIFSGELEDG
jgi:hypothetical protein